MSRAPAAPLRLRRIPRVPPRVSRLTPYRCVAGPSRLAPQSPLGSAVLTVTVAVALPLSVSLAASLVYLVRRWLDGARCCRRRPPGAQVYPLQPAVYTVPQHNGRTATANGVPRRGQEHTETANQNGGITEVGENERKRLNGRVAPLQNGPVTSRSVRSEADAEPVTSDAVNEPVTTRPVHNEPAGRSLMTPGAVPDERDSIATREAVIAARRAVRSGRYPCHLSAVAGVCAGAVCGAGSVRAGRGAGAGCVSAAGRWVRAAGRPAGRDRRPAAGAGRPSSRRWPGVRSPRDSADRFALCQSGQSGPSGGQWSVNGPCGDWTRARFGEGVKKCLCMRDCGC